MSAVPKKDSVRLPAGFEAENLDGGFTKLAEGATGGQFRPGDGTVDFGQNLKGFLGGKPLACPMGEKLPASVQARTWLSFKFVADDGSVSVIEVPWTKPKKAIYSRLESKKSLFDCKVRFSKTGSDSRPKYDLEFLEGETLDGDVLEGAQGTKVFLERMATGESPYVRENDDDGDEDEIDVT